MGPIPGKTGGGIAGRVGSSVSGEGQGSYLIIDNTFLDARVANAWEGSAWLESQFGPPGLAPVRGNHLHNVHGFQGGKNPAWPPHCCPKNFKGSTRKALEGHQQPRGFPKTSTHVQ